MATDSEEKFLRKLEIILIQHILLITINYKNVFPRNNRLTTEWEIKRVYKKGARINNPLFFLWFFPNWHKKNRATVTVSKKYDKRAVYRNKLKRTFREAAHHMVLSLQPSADIIILPKTDAAQKNFHEIYQELDKTFAQLPERITNFQKRK